MYTKNTIAISFFFATHKQLPCIVYVRLLLIERGRRKGLINIIVLRRTAARTDLVIVRSRYSRSLPLPSSCAQTRLQFQTFTA